MSIKVMGSLIGATMPSAQKAVLLALGWHADDEGTCWPSIARLVTVTCLSERTVQGALKCLEAEGWITRKMATGRSTRYRVIPRDDPAPPQRLRGYPRRDRTPPPQQLHPNSQGTVIRNSQRAN